MLPVSSRSSSSTTSRCCSRSASRAAPAALDLPDGTVTFVFVDMADSTRIAAELPGVYPAIVETFQAALAETVGRHGGVVVDTEGDGAFCVFSTAHDAATAAASFQREVIERAWSDDVPVRARIGLHTGSAERTANNYVGLEVHRAARIGAAANAGQILVSRSAATLIASTAGSSRTSARSLSRGSTAPRSCCSSTHPGCPTSSRRRAPGGRGRCTSLRNSPLW